MSLARDSRFNQTLFDMFDNYLLVTITDMNIPYYKHKHEDHMYLVHREMLETLYQKLKWENIWACTNWL
jgi:hypothetical protein